MTTTDTEEPLGPQARSSLLPATTPQWTVLVAGLLLLAAAAGFLVASLRDAPPDPDVRRADAAHHEGGVHMAAHAAEHATDPFVRDLAQRMARNQAIEIQELEAAAERADLPEVTAVESDAHGDVEHPAHSHD